MSRYAGGGYGAGGTNPYANGYGAGSNVNPYGGSAPSTSPYGESAPSEPRNPYGESIPSEPRNPYGESADSQDRYAGGSGAAASTNPYGNSSYGTSATSLRGGGAAAGTSTFQSRNRRQGGFVPGSMGPPPPRDGGYGGYGTTAREEAKEDETAAVNRPTSLERSQAKRRSGPSQSAYGQRSPTRRLNGTGTGGQQIEDVLRYIQRDWDSMTDDKCVPVEVALKLMDDSSLGLAERYNQFRELHQQLQNALRVIVNEHHQGFNSSIGTFHSIQAAIQTSQVRLRSLRENLFTAKSSLSTTKPELKGLATRSQEFDDMLQILNAIERLQEIPEKLEARISGKRFLSAVELLQDGLKTVRNSEMDGIGALSDLRVYLSNQEHSLTDIMIEELHNHLYLKSPYCENRWKSYAPNQSKSSFTTGQAGAVTVRQLYQFLDKMDTSKVVQDDPARNPEADTFLYIQLIVESLNSLGRLDSVVDVITQRLPVELFKVVEKSINEADQRHPSSLRGVKGGLDTLDRNNNARGVVLNDLLGTLYARFEAIAECHRVVHEVIAGILKREGMRSSSAMTGGFRELWKLYQSEIRSLLHDYLAADGNTSYRSGDRNMRPGSIFVRTQRDKSKRLFKLTDMDAKSSDMNSERDDLEAILKASVPGLVSDSKRPNLIDQSSSNGNTDSSAAGHKLLVEPSVFNMGVLLPPSLTFLNRLKEVVPPTSDIALSTLTSFLDDFLVNVFLPQLEETLGELCVQTFIEFDAFQQDPHWAQHSQRPIFKGTNKFFKLISAFCRMLDNLPHDQAFSHLIITQIMTYYEKCHGWYKALIARSKPHPQSGSIAKMAPFLMDTNAELRDVVFALSQLEDAGAAERTTLLDVETGLLVQSTDRLRIEEADILSDRRNIAALGMLHTSMKWLASKTAQLRYISNDAIDSTRRESRHAANRRWTFVAGSRGPADTDKVYLPLNGETAEQFDAAVDLYRQLAATASRTLHVEVRCHVLHYIEKSLRRTFLLENEVNEPDPEVVALNADIVVLDEVFSTYLQDKVRSFILTGLASLLDTLLLHASASIPAMNTNGCNRLQLNILVLQQNLKNIEPAAQLPRSARYYDLFRLGPAQILNLAKEQGKNVGFSSDEVQRLLTLAYSEGLRSDRREVSVAAERGLASDELALSEYLW